MERYKNLRVGSAVLGYEIGNDFIKVIFEGGKAYTYTHASAGESNVERMKLLAVEGKGLNTFIDRHMQKRYAYKSALIFGTPS